ncbi:hypothetical protein WME79_46865 [Sorangium sp. So ce726]|uniref:hypothetical protein n=1 Tax=Sorangium sp. So ce726 TaxID=3133319 RepID=UPI003F5D5872
MSAACAFVLVERRASQAEVALDRMQSSLDDLTDKVESVDRSPRRTPTVITMERRAAPDTVDGADSESPGPSDQPSSPSSEPSPQDAPSHEEQKEFLELSFSAQAPDVSWSRGAAAQVDEMVRPLTDRNTRLVSTDCRATLCRVELTHTTEDAFHAFMTTAIYGGGMRSWKGAGGGGLLRRDPDGTVRTVVYLAKEGAELPILN